MTHMPETFGSNNSETVLGIAPEVLESTQNFEERRNTLNDWLAVQRADNLVIDFDDQNDVTLTLVLETSEAFGDMAEALIRSYGIEGACPVIAQAWCIDGNERAKLLNSLSGTQEIVIQEKDDFEATVTGTIGDRKDDKNASAELAAEFAAVLHGNIAEYACLLEDAATDGTIEEGLLDIRLEDLIINRDMLAMKSLRQVLGQLEQNS